MNLAKISAHYDIRDFVSPVVWDEWALKSKWFIQSRIVNICELLHHKIALQYDIPVTNVTVKVNNWLEEGRKNGITDAGYRSGLDYLNKEGKPRTDIDMGDFDSFHRQGHCANISVEILKDDQIVYLSSYDIATLILEYEDDFIITGLTTMSEPRKHTKYLHVDCRNTNSFKIKIMNID